MPSSSQRLKHRHEELPRLNTAHIEIIKGKTMDDTYIYCWGTAFPLRYKREKIWGLAYSEVILKAKH